MRLILVRHGQTTANVDELLDTGAPGALLTALGHTQAAALPAALAAERIDVLYVSTLLRTHQTAAPLAAARGLEPQVRAGLREVRAGSLELRGDEPAIHRYLSTTLAWSRGEVDLRMPGAETGAEVYARYDAVVAEIEGTGAATAVVVSHGAVIRSWSAARAGNVSPELAARSRLSNTGAIVLEGATATGWHAVTWEGRALGGPAVEDPPGTEGPAGEPVGDRAGNLPR